MRSVSRADAVASTASVQRAGLAQPLTWSTLVGLAGTILLPILGWLAIIALLKRATTVRAAAAPPALPPPDAHEADSTSLAAQLTATVTRSLVEAVEYLVAARASLDRLPEQLPLRRVLARELSAAGRSLDEVVSRLASDSAAADKQPMPTVLDRDERIEALVRDLRRLAEIADGACSSIMVHNAVADTLEPRNKAEAYRLLGINPDVSDAIAKKLVEALRQSWHPDLARDAADRQEREERLKRINVAWDLIRKRRAETVRT